MLRNVKLGRFASFFVCELIWIKWKLKSHSFINSFGWDVSVCQCGAFFRCWTALCAVRLALADVLFVIYVCTLRSALPVRNTNILDKFVDCAFKENHRHYTIISPISTFVTELWWIWKIGLKHEKSTSDDYTMVTKCLIKIISCVSPICFFVPSKFIFNLSLLHIHQLIRYDTISYYELVWLVRLDKKKVTAQLNLSAVALLCSFLCPYKIFNGIRP